MSQTRDTPEEVNKPKQRLPKVSILVPLFRETEIAHALIARLTRLTYPKCLLDVILVMEEEDRNHAARHLQVSICRPGSGR